MTSEIFGFSSIDYILFALALCMSAAIGIYFGCFGSKQNSATEYLFGAGKRNMIPIGISIYSSAVSAITIVGSPTEIYTFGTQFMMIYIGALLSLFITWIFVLPVFCGDLNINTPYEYFELRFNYKIRLMSTAIYVLHTYVYLPTILYAATVAFTEVTNISLPICTTVIGGVCIFYTMLGGFSGVIWSDSLQATLMFISCTFVLIKAIVNVGGFEIMWERAEQGERINFFTMDPNPFRRLTFWSAIFGIMFNHAAHSGCGASAIQRYMALKNEKQAKISTLIGVGGTSIFGIIVSLIGLAMYAQYYNCDPVKNKEITGSNKLSSHFIAQTVSDIPGFLGFFNAGLVSAGLSTLSAELNTVSGLIYHCFVKKLFKKTSGEKRGAVIMKLIVLINGLIYLAIAPLLDKAKYIFSLGLALAGVSYGAKVGMIILGTAFPKTNSLGIACGTISGIVFITWIIVGSMYYDVASLEVLPVTTSTCISNNFTEVFNATNLPITRTDDPLFFYKLSFMYYPLVGTLITIIIGLIVSYISGANNVNEMDPNLFIPYVRPKITQESCPEEIHMIKKSLKP